MRPVGDLDEDLVISKTDQKADGLTNFRTLAGDEIGEYRASRSLTTNSGNGKDGRKTKPLGHSSRKQVSVVNIRCLVR